MTKSIVLQAFFLITLLSFSCYKNQPDGKWKDNIKLSQKTLHFDSSADTAIVTTESSGWWLNNIDFNGKAVDISDVKVTAQEFVVEKPEFTVARKNEKKIIISMNRNNSGSERILRVALQNGDYFDGIKVTQEK